MSLRKYFRMIRRLLMRILLGSLLAFCFLLVACRDTAADRLASPLSSSNTDVLTENVNETSQQTPENEKGWADAYAAAFSQRRDEFFLVSAALMDIDGDGVPEAVEYGHGTGGGFISRIYGYENGDCGVWYDFENNTDRISNIFFIEKDGFVKCVATSQWMRGWSREFSVYELVKGIYASGETAFVPVPLMTTSSLISESLITMDDEVSEIIELLVNTQNSLYERVLASLGEEYIPERVVYIDFLNAAAHECSEEQLASIFREW